jgi:hypothetical protein
MAVSKVTHAKSRKSRIESIARRTNWQGIKNSRWERTGASAFKEQARTKEHKKVKSPGLHSFDGKHT